MKVYDTQEIRNVGVVGHGAAGKTSLVEAMLFTAGAVQRLGRVIDGTTVTDYDEDEHARKISIHTSVCFAPWKNAKINLLDTPGYNEFIFDARASLQVTDNALVIVNAVHGVEVQTAKVWGYADELSLPRAIAVNKLDSERADFTAAVQGIQESLTRKAIPFQIPIGKEREFRGIVDLFEMKAYLYATDGSGKFQAADMPAEQLEEAEKAREALIEMIAESDESLLEKFFEAGTLPSEDLIPGARKAILSGLVPIFCTAGTSNIGAAHLMDALVNFMPSPADAGPAKGFADEEFTQTSERAADPHAPYSAFVFRTIADQFGRITVFRVCSGTLKADSTVFNGTRNAQERLGPTHVIQGRSLEKIQELRAGDIGAVTKLKETFTGDTFADKASPIYYPKVKYPTPGISFAVEPKSRADEEKIGVALHKMLEEDLALHFTREAQTKEFLLSGTGQLHVEVAVEKLKKRYGVEVTLKPPRVPYKETFRSKVEVQGRHKKQTGGRGQFGDCVCVFSPLPRGGGFEFVDKIFGGAVPQNFRPAIEKGIIESAESGPLTGSPVVDFRVELIDGSYHTVDSDELSFKLAGRKAFRGAMEKGSPYLLEPIMDVEVLAPTEFSGDLMGDLNQRRGRIQGMEARSSEQVIKAQAPMSEMLNYQPTLNSITGGRGSYSMVFSHYDEVPSHISQKVVHEAVAEGRVRSHEEE